MVVANIRPLQPNRADTRDLGVQTDVPRGLLSMGNRACGNLAALDSSCGNKEVKWDV